MTHKKILIIAGPNGAGKTTFAREFLPNDAACPRFINADLIAAGLSPFAPESAAIKAGRLMVEMMDELTLRGESFAVETTLAARSYVSRIAHWQSNGYHVKLFFLTLPSPEVAVARVELRVSQGGHHVPEDLVRKRYAAGRLNFDRLYRDQVDSWTLYDNSGPRPTLLDWKRS